MGPKARLYVFDLNYYLLIQPYTVLFMDFTLWAETCCWNEVCNMHQLCLTVINSFIITVSTIG